MWSAVLVLTASVLLLTETSAQNGFDAIIGCKQQAISRSSYNLQNPYYAIDQFRDVQTVEVAGLKIKTIKLSVMASNDAVIRLAPVDQPYQNTLMNEIVLSGWSNTINAVRQYVRSSPSRVSRNVIVVNQPSGRMLSPYQPFVFTLSIINDFMVVLTKVGETLPFLQYVNTAVQPKYISFSNWNAPVSVFYDCPPLSSPSPPPPPPPSTQKPPATTAPCQQQTISRPSYNLQNPYYAIDQFRDVRNVEVAGLKIQTIKLSVIASNDAVIRLAPIDQPYQNTLMNEIVLSGWGNTINAVRQYVRSSPSRVSSNVIVVNQPSGRMLSPYKPFVFTLSIINDHMVVLTKDGESLPFLQYVNAAVQPKYIGFSNWNAPVSVVYDCPNQDGTGSENQDGAGSGNQDGNGSGNQGGSGSENQDGAGL